MNMKDQYLSAYSLVRYQLDFGYHERDVWAELANIGNWAIGAAWRSFIASSYGAAADPYYLKKPGSVLQTLKDRRETAWRRSEWKREIEARLSDPLFWDGLELTQVQHDQIERRVRAMMDEMKAKGLKT